jgi:hypothetical protein
MTPYHARCPAGLLGKVFYERTFASACLTAHKRDFARSHACVLQVMRQFFELGLAFEQVHGRTEYPARRLSRTWAAQPGGPELAI